MLFLDYDTHIHSSRVNSGMSSCEGIETCGQRLFEEIKEVIGNLDLTEKPRLTFIGHSFGGIIIRYAIGLMLESGILDEFEPFMYMTFATPHVGTIRSKNFFDKTVTWFTRNVVSQTGRDLLIEDEGKLLKRMADPGDNYYKALALFPHKILYSNIKNDVPVQFPTASICSSNPYDNRDFRFVDKLADFPHIVKSSLVSKEYIDPNTNTTENEIYIIENLNNLEWKRYDVLFEGTILAHEQIINKRILLEGEDVILHSIIEWLDYNKN